MLSFNIVDFYCRLTEQPSLVHWCSTTKHTSTCYCMLYQYYTEKSYLHKWLPYTIITDLGLNVLNGNQAF